MFKTRRCRNATLYFLLIQLCVIDHMYKYLLESFKTFYFKAIDNTAPNDDDEKRVVELRLCIRMTRYRWNQRGLFVSHKQIFLTQLTFRLMQLGIL